jgi:hypothetical protein
MTLLDRFRAQPPNKHSDPAVRLAYVAEIPLDERDLIVAMAREDDDPRVRRAAVAKLMDPAPLGQIARDDHDESVRAAAISMLRDIALEAFEGIGDADSMAAVNALADARALAQIAKESGREATVLLALSRLTEPRLLGSVARHAASEAGRRRAFERLKDQGDRAEMLATAMNGEFKDIAVAAVDVFTDRADLEQIASRSRNKSAAKRARTILREANEQAAPAAGHEAENVTAEALPAHDSDSPQLVSDDAVIRAPEPNADAPPYVAATPPAPAVTAEEDADERGITAEAGGYARAEPEAAEHARARAEADTAARESARRHVRLAELAETAEAVVVDEDLASARKHLGVVRREWKDLVTGIAVDPALASRMTDAQSRLDARDAEAREAEAHTRREALARLQQLLNRVESLAARPEVSLKAADRALRDIRAALGSIPPLPSKQDYEEGLRRLKGAQAVWTAKVQELREADEWHRWANVAIQEELCAKMEALSGLEDPEAIAREVRELQEQWRKAAEVPPAKADALWRRFKAAHDQVWPRCEAHFAEQARTRAENLAKKVSLCERAEALAESTSWIQTAEEVKRLQAEWKTIGPVSRGREKAIWERFRAACDRFFTRRHDDLARRKVQWADALTKKDALCVRAEALAQSTDWEAAAAEIRRLQGEWKTIGPVKKSRSEAIWQRFRGACDLFFSRYAQRHETARAERVAAREALCAELDALLPSSDAPSEGPPPELLARVKSIRSRWQQEIAARGVDPDRARALDQRFETSFAAVAAAWPAVFEGSDLDPHANRKRLEALVRRVEDLARSVDGPAAEALDATVSPGTRLAAMLKEALAANTIGGKVDDDSRLRAALEEVRQAQASWSRVGPVPEPVRRPLAERFQRACRRIQERQGERQDGRQPWRAEAIGKR